MMEREIRNHHIRHVAANGDKAANSGIDVFTHPNAGIATHEEPIRRMSFKHYRINDHIRMIASVQWQPGLPQIFRDQHVTIWRSLS